MKSKTLVFTIAALFLLTSLSSVYAGSVLDVLESKKVDKPEPIEIESYIETYRESEIPYPFPDKHELEEQYYNHHFEKHYPLRKPTQIDGEDWDIVVPDDYSTIQQAIDQAEEGNRILVRSGYYKENIIINTSGIKVFGENTNTTIIDGDYKADVLEILSDDVTISGFIIQNSGYLIKGEYYAGVDVQGDNITIINNNISNNLKYGLVLFQSQYNTISSNIISENNNDGIQLFSSKNNMLSHNILMQNGEHDFSLLDSHENIIMNNSISSSYSSGCHLSRSHNNSIAYNIIESVDENALSLFCSAFNIICFNTIISDGNAGIDLRYDSDYNIIVSNQISSTFQYRSEHGIYIRCCIGNTVADNYCNNYDVALSIEGSSEINIQNNSIFHNNQGLCLKDADDCKISYNIFDKNFNLGIELISNCQHNLINNNIIIGLGYGDAIWIKEYSNANLIKENTLEKNADGIHISLSYENVIIDNIIGDNDANGIYLVEAQYTEICSNNIFSNEQHGMYIWHQEYRASNLCIQNNTFIDNAVLMYNSYSNSVVNNTVNGKPLIYLENQRDVCIDNISAGEVIFIQCQNITLCNQVIENDDTAVILISSCNCTIKNNHFEGNQYALYMLYAVDNEISYNNFIDNDQDCFFVQWVDQHYGDFNRFSENYWDAKNSLFHPLIGKKYIRVIIWYHDIRIICVDFSPVGEPYDIGG